MACARVDPEPVGSSLPVKIFHHERDNCCVILWHLQHFTTCADINYGVSSLFKVNVRCPRSWSFEMCFKTEAVEERQFYGICLSPLIVIPDDIKITCRFSIVENNGELYSAEPCFLKITKLTGHIVFGHLIEKEFLSQNESRFLRHDTLLIQCDLNVESSKVQPKDFPCAEDYQYFSSKDLVCNMMRGLYKERKYSNLTWALGTNIENVHKSILAARSRKFSEELTRRIGLQPDVQTFDIDDDVALALLLYIYTANPYEIKCIPLGLKEEAEKYGLPLLAYFAEPHTMTFRSRIKVQELNLALNIKNFYTETGKKRNSILFRFEIFEIGSKWSLFLDFQEEGEINFRLSKLSSVEIPMTIELKNYVINTDNQCVLLNTQMFHSVSDSKETYSFATSATCLPNLVHDNHLKLKIAMKVSYHCIQDHGKEYEMTFSSELSGAEQKNPPDFQRLKADILNMYESEIFPDLILEPETGKVFVHRFIAAFHSPFIATHLDPFQRLESVDTATPLGEPLQPQSISMPKVAQWTMEAIARFMYTGELGDFELKHAVAFLHAANKYELTHLRNEILRYLRRNLNRDTCKIIHDIASTFGEEELRSEAFQLICSDLNTTPQLVDFWLQNRESAGEADLSARPSMDYQESFRNRQATSRYLEPMGNMSRHMKEKKKSKSKLKRMKKVADDKNRSLKATEKKSEVSKSEEKKESESVGGIGRCFQCLQRSGKEDSDEENVDEEASKRHDKIYKNVGRSSLPTETKVKIRGKHETSVNFQGMDVKDIKRRSRRKRYMKKLNIRIKGKGPEGIREVQLVMIGRNLDISPRLSIGHQMPQEIAANQPLSMDDTSTRLSTIQSTDGGQRESGDQGQITQHFSPRYRGRIVGRVLEDIESRPLLSIDNATRVSDAHKSAKNSTVSSPQVSENKDLAVPPIPSTYDDPPILSPERNRFFKHDVPLVSHRPDLRCQDLDAPITDDTISVLNDGHALVIEDQGISLPDVYQDLAVPPIPSTDDTIPVLSPRRARITEDRGIPLSDAVHQDLTVPLLQSTDDAFPTLNPICITEDQGILPDSVSQVQDVPPLPSTYTVPMLSPEHEISFGRLGPMFTPRPGMVYRDLTDVPILSSERSGNGLLLGPMFSPPFSSTEGITDMLESEPTPLAEDQEIPQPDVMHQDVYVPALPCTDDTVPMLSHRPTRITKDQEISLPDEVHKDLYVPPKSSTDDNVPMLNLERSRNGVHLDPRLDAGSTVPPLPSTDDTEPMLSHRPTRITEDQEIPLPDEVHQDLYIPPLPSTDDNVPMLSLERSRNGVHPSPFSSRTDAVYQSSTVPPLPSTDDTVPILSHRPTRIAEDQEIPLPEEMHQDLYVPPLPSTDDIIPLLSPRPIGITEDQEIPLPDEVHQDLYVPPLPRTDDNIPMLSFERFRNGVHLDPFSSLPDAVYQGSTVPPLPNTDDTEPMLSHRPTFISEDQEVPLPDEVHHDLYVPPLPSTDDTEPKLSLERSRNGVHPSLFSSRTDAVYQSSTVPPLPSTDDTVPILSHRPTSIAEEQEIPLPDEVHQDLQAPSLPSTDDTEPMLSPRPTLNSEDQEPSVVPQLDAPHKEPSDPEASP